MNLKQAFNRLILFDPINSYSNIYFFNQGIQDNIMNTTCIDRFSPIMTHSIIILKYYVGETALYI